LNFFAVSQLFTIENNKKCFLSSKSA